MLFVFFYLIYFHRELVQFIYEKNVQGQNILQYRYCGAKENYVNK